MAYFSNASEGEVLDEQCHDCPLGAGWNDPNQRKLFDDYEDPMRPCPVAFVQLQYNYRQGDKGDLRDAMNILISDRGECMVRKQLVEIRQEQAR